MNKKIYYTTMIINGVEVFDRVQPCRGDQKPVPEKLNWKLFKGTTSPARETPVERYDDNGRYLSDEEWLKKQNKKDPRGRWYHKETKEQITIYGIDALPLCNDYTQKPPLENEPYQYFDEDADDWVVDEEQKEDAKKQAEINAKQAEIEAAEKAILRSLIAKQAGVATQEDEEYFEQYATKIQTLREEKQQLLSAEEMRKSA